MDLEFETIEDLYRRLIPALRTKRREMRRNGYPYIKEEDIWNYLKEVKWVRARNLLLYEMVNDVLGASEEQIDGYLKEKLNRRNRTIYFNEEER
jgi:hypothetical protein